MSADGLSDASSPPRQTKATDHGTARRRENRNTSGMPMVAQLAFSSPLHRLQRPWTAQMTTCPGHLIRAALGLDFEPREIALDSSSILVPAEIVPVGSLCFSARLSTSLPSLSFASHRMPRDCWTSATKASGGQIRPSRRYSVSSMASAGLQTEVPCLLQQQFTQTRNDREDSKILQADYCDRGVGYTRCSRQFGNSNPQTK